MSKVTAHLIASKPVALTGGMGSGKSSVARFWKQQFGIDYIDADQVCRDLLTTGASGWKIFVATFGNEFLAENRSIDRQKLRDAIFVDHKLRRRLDKLIHPLARDEIKNMLTGIEPARCLVEVPLLYEAGWEKDFSSIVVVSATDECCLDRLIERDQITREAAKQAIATQLTLSEKANRADYVIDNSGTWQDTCLQLLSLGDILWRKGVA